MITSDGCVLGGYPEGVANYIGQPEVQKALHLDPNMAGASRFHY